MLRNGTPLCIRQTWDGVPTPPADWVNSTLRLDRRALRLAVDAPFHGDPPPPGRPGSTPRLWEHEVVELFVLHDAVGAPPRYTEIELGPHGHHLVLRLEGVRTVVDSGLPLDYRAELVDGGARWRGEARLPAALLPPPPHRINLYAIHGQGDARRYLALHPVPGETPDFHRVERFQPLPPP